jgi:hypothetical protein
MMTYAAILEQYYHQPIDLRILPEGAPVDTIDPVPGKKLVIWWQSPPINESNNRPIQKSSPRALRPWNNRTRNALQRKDPRTHFFRDSRGTPTGTPEDPPEKPKKEEHNGNTANNN